MTEQYPRCYYAYFLRTVMCVSCQINYSFTFPGHIILNSFTSSAVAITLSSNICFSWTASPRTPKFYDTINPARFSISFFKTLKQCCYLFEGGFTVHWSSHTIIKCVTAPIVVTEGIPVAFCARCKVLGEHPSCPWDTTHEYWWQKHAICYVWWWLCKATFERWVQVKYPGRC